MNAFRRIPQPTLMAGPAFLIAALIFPNLIAIFDSNALHQAQSWLGNESRSYAAWFWVQRALLVIGLSAGVISGSLALYRWTIARRILHLFLFVVLLELFYRFAYGGPVSPGLLRSVPETSERETLELLAGHPALTWSLSVVAMLAVYALILSWGKNIRFSSRWCARIGFVSVAMITMSLAIGMIQIREMHRFQHVVLAESRSTFPVDIAVAFGSVTTEWAHTRHQAAARLAFKFSNPHLRDAESRNHASEIYVIVVGETSRRINWSLFGYSRPTTPRLDAMKSDLILFNRMTSNATNTILSLPMALTRAAPESRDIVFAEKSVITLLKQAGFKTFWISNQERAGLSSNPITQIALEADYVSFPDDGQRAGLTDHFDSNLVTRFADQLARLPEGTKAVIFLHMEGSHFGYKERFPEDFGRFGDDDETPQKLPSRQARLVNDYDNSVYFTDYNVERIINRLKGCGCKSGLLFFSDHGERLFDNGAGDVDFGHGFPTIAPQEIQIPFFIWLSNTYREANPSLVANLQANAKFAAQLHNLFETIADFAGVDSDDRNSALSLFSDKWNSPKELEVLNLEEKIITLPVEGTHR